MEHTIEMLGHLTWPGVAGLLIVTMGIVAALWIVFKL